MSQEIKPPETGAGQCLGGQLVGWECWTLDA